MKPEFYLVYAAVEDRHWWHVSRRAILHDLLLKLDLPSGAKILDAGCASGGNLPMLARFGKVQAFEMEEQAQKIAQARGVGPVERGSLPHEVPFTDGQFDLVTALDVIEHVEKDIPALEKLLLLLKPGGHVVITVPALPSLWSRHDVVNQHFRRYRKAELYEKLTRAGFELRFCSYYNFFLFPVVWLFRKLKNMTESREADLHLPIAPVNGFFKRIFSAEKYWLRQERSFPIGVSILAVAKRPF